MNDDSLGKCLLPSLPLLASNSENSYANLISLRLPEPLVLIRGIQPRNLYAPRAASNGAPQKKCESPVRLLLLESEHSLSIFWGDTGSPH